MHPNETAREDDARQPEDLPPPPHLSAGECGDAIWEGSACQGGMVDASARDGGSDAAQPGGREAGIRGGRFIDLVERRPRGPQVEG
jgi:hypothetical protein